MGLPMRRRNNGHTPPPLMRGGAGAVSTFACSEPIGRKDGTDNKSTGSGSSKGLSSVDLRPANAKVNEILNRPTAPTL